MHYRRNKKDIENLVNQLAGKKIDMLVRNIHYTGGQAYICYIGQLVDRQAVSELVIKPILDYCVASKEVVTASVAVNNILYADQCLLSENLDQVEAYILNGQTVILFSNDMQYVVINRKKVERRAVSPPELTYSYRAPRDAFVEDLDTNLSLLRYRLKDGNLRVVKKELGTRTKTSAVIVYIEDIANPLFISEVNKRIDAIRVDGIYETGELQSFLLNKKTDIFPQMAAIERSDMAVEKLLEGKVLILVDGSNLVLQAPVVFAELLYSCDDRYDNKYFGLFMRLIRYIGVIIFLTSTSIYVALAEFHPDAMPASYIVTFAQMRSRAPFSAFLAVVSVEFIVELVREALLRVPIKIGSAIGIVGAIIIGQAASQSGIYSPLLLILVSMGFLSSFAIPDMTLANPLRLFKFLNIFMTGFFGFFGFSVAIVFFLSLVVSESSFGLPYMAPWAPYNSYDAKRSLIFNKRDSKKRPKYMRNKDNNRAKDAKQQ